MSESVIDKKAVAESFGKAAPRYDSVAHFQRWAGQQALDLIPEGAYPALMDLGSGTGYFLDKLSPYCQGGQPLAVDLAFGMANYAREQHGGLANYVVADAESLPFQAGSFDLVFSSLSIQWCYDLKALFSEISRVLKPGGVFVFSTLLDGTLYELEQSWKASDAGQHVNSFPTLKNYSDALAGLDAEFLALDEREKVLRYDNVLDLMRELKTLGAHNMTDGRSRKLTGKSKLMAMQKQYEQFRNSEGTLPATYQLGLGLLRNNRTEN